MRVIKKKKRKNLLGEVLHGRAADRGVGVVDQFGHACHHHHVPLLPWLRVQGSGFRVQGSGFRVQGAGFRVQGSGFRVQGVGCRVKGVGCGV